MDWQRLDVDLDAIAELYTSLVREVPQSVAVWSSVEGSKVHFFTVLDKKLAAEPAVYAAEAAVLEQFDQALIEFHVYPDKGPIKAFIQDLTPLLLPLDALRG